MGFAIRSAAAFALAASAVPVLAIGAASEPVPVSTGADFVSPPSVPEQFYLDARTRPAIAAWKPGDPIREIPRQFHGEEEGQRHPPAPANPVLPGTDLLIELQREVGHPAAVDAFTTPLVNIVGQGNTGVFPPDPSGDVGGGYFVQAINGSGGALFKIYNTADGSAAAGPFSMDGLGSGGPCASGLGDGVVVFDQLAQRWLFTEFANVGNNLCVYLSATANPVTTTWTRYVFTTPSFPDYPKYGVWPDAYYVGANEGPAVYALDRAKMLAAQPATLQRKTVPSLGGLGFQMVVPGSVSGSTPPPAGAPGIFGRDNDDERNSPGSNDPTRDFIELFAMHVDWTTPGNTTLTGPIRVDEAEFDSEFNVTSGFGAIHQPNTSQTLDPLLEVLMYPLYYRNFGDHEALIGNHVTQIQTGNIAGVRWFELRRTGGAGGSWSMYQQGTFAPADAGGQISRWMAAIGMDQTGNIALGYSVARATPAVFPGLSYTGRLATDPLGVMTQPETSLVAGVTSQTQADRWGDYHQMGVDPADGCTFWFTGEYMTSGSQWTTRVSSFKFDACGTTVGFTLSATNLTQNVCAATATPVDLQPVSITVAALNGFNLPVTMSFAPPGLPIGFAGNYAPNPVTPPGTTVASLDVTNASTPGPHSVILRGTGDGVDHDLTLAVDVATQVPTQVALVAPADNATGQPSQPTFSWAAAAQSAGYLIEISTSPTFATTILAQTLPGGQTTFTPTAALPVATQLYWRVTATNTCGTGVASPTFTFTTADGPRPTIVVNPTAIAATAAAGAVVTKTVTIGNTGTLDLNWTIDESAVADCSTASSIPWMTVSPVSGLVHAGAIPQATTVNLNATGLTPGSYSAAICVHSNDPTHLVTPVPVTFTVTGPPTATISVSPTSIATSVSAGASATATLAIGNTGNATLTWTADTSATACTSPTAVGWLTIAPTSGSVSAGSPANDVTVTTDSTGLAAGTYGANICVHANDTAHPLTSIPVSFEVIAVDLIFADGFDGSVP